MWVLETNLGTLQEQLLYTADPFLQTAMTLLNSESSCLSFQSEIFRQALLCSPVNHLTLSLSKLEILSIKNKL